MAPTVLSFDLQQGVLTVVEVVEVDVAERVVLKCMCEF